MFTLLEHNTDTNSCKIALSYPSIPNVTEIESQFADNISMDQWIRKEFAHWLCYASADLVQHACNIIGQREVLVPAKLNALERMRSMLKWWSANEDYKTLLRSWHSIRIIVAYAQPDQSYTFHIGFADWLAGINQLVAEFSAEYFNQIPWQIKPQAQATAA